MRLLPIGIAWMRVRLAMVCIFAVAFRAIAAARTAKPLRSQRSRLATRFTLWHSNHEAQLVKMRLQVVQYFLPLLDTAAFVIEAFFNALLAKPVPYIALNTTIIDADADASGVLAGLNVLMHRIISSSDDLPLAELDPTATVLQAERAEITAATSVSAIDGVASVPVGKGHFAPWATHRKNIVYDMLLCLEDFNSFLLH